MLQPLNIKGVSYLKKFIFILGIFFLSMVTISMPVISYSSWKDQQNFSKGDKGKAEALIKVDEHNVKTYNFKENEYGVDASKSSWKKGDKVTIYFLKSKPYIVAENPYVYNSKFDILSPLIWFIFCGGMTIWIVCIHYLHKKLRDNNNK